MSGKTYLNETLDNPNGDVVVIGGPVLVAKTKASEIPAPGSGVALSEDNDTAGQLNLLSSAGTVSVSTTGATFPATAASVTVTQTAGASDGATTTIAAQSAGGSNKNGGNLMLGGGTQSGGGNPGYVGLKCGAATELLVGPYDITIVPATVQFSAASAAPTIKQYAAAADTAGQTLTIAAQAGTKATLDVNGGGLVLQSGAAGGSGDVGAVTVKTGATTILTADKTGITINATKLGLFGGTPAAKPAVTGAKADAVAASILAALVAIGAVTDSTT